MPIFRVDVQTNSYAHESADAIVSMPQFRLVRAKSRTAAERYVATKLLVGRLANFTDGLEAAKANIEIEDSTDE